MRTPLAEVVARLLRFFFYENEVGFVFELLDGEDGVICGGL